ncbi:hypothetical protein, partial [Bacteroides caccae]
QLKENEPIFIVNEKKRRRIVYYDTPSYIIKAFIYKNATSVLSLKRGGKNFVVKGREVCALRGVTSLLIL